MDAEIDTLIVSYTSELWAEIYRKRAQVAACQIFEWYDAAAQINQCNHSMGQQDQVVKAIFRDLVDYISVVSHFKILKHILKEHFRRLKKMSRFS